MQIKYCLMFYVSINRRVSLGGGVRWQQIMGGGENIDISLLDTLVFCLWPNASKYQPGR